MYKFTFDDTDESGGQDSAVKSMPRRTTYTTLHHMHHIRAAIFWLFPHYVSPVLCMQRGITGINLASAISHLLDLGHGSMQLHVQDRFSATPAVYNCVKF